MNIIITLPQELIADILNGHKTIELRKTYPMRYRELVDWVYVVTKGKASVQLAFQVSGFQRVPCVDEVWKRYHKQISVSYDWFYRYTVSECYLFFWYISTIAYSSKPIPLSDIKPDGKAPQSYVYCDTPFESLPFTVMSNPKTRK